MAQRILLVVGALFVAWGSALQAVNEIGQYDELLEALKKSDLGPSLEEGLKLSMTWTLWPMGIPRMFRWIKRYITALNKFTEMAVGQNKDIRTIGIRTGLRKARNWTIVLVGSILVLAASVVELLTS